MSSSFLGAMAGVAVVDQATNARLAEMDRNAAREREMMDIRQASNDSFNRAQREKAMDAQAESLMGLIKSEATKTSLINKNVVGVQDNVNFVHDHIEEQTVALKEFVAHKEQEQSKLIQDVLSVVKEQSEEIKALRQEMAQMRCD